MKRNYTNINETFIITVLYSNIQDFKEHICTILAERAKIEYTKNNARLIGLDITLWNNDTFKSKELLFIYPYFNSSDIDLSRIYKDNVKNVIYVKLHWIYIQ